MYNQNKEVVAMTSSLLIVSVSCPIHSIYSFEKEEPLHSPHFGTIKKTTNQLFHQSWMFRCRRFAMVLNDGQVETLLLEDDQALQLNINNEF